MSCGTTKVALFTTLVDDGKLALPALELCLPPRRCAFAIARYAEGLTKPGLRPHSPRPAGPASPRPRPAPSRRARLQLRLGSREPLQLTM